MCVRASLFVQRACICFIVRAVLIIPNFICIFVIHSRLIFRCIYFVFPSTRHLFRFPKRFVFIKTVLTTSTGRRANWRDCLVNVSAQRFRSCYSHLPSFILFQFRVGRRELKFLWCKNRSKTDLIDLWPANGRVRAIQSETKNRRRSSWHQVQELFAKKLKKRECCGQFGVRCTYRTQLAMKEMRQWMVERREKSENRLTHPISKRNFPRTM